MVEETPLQTQDEGMGKEIVIEEASDVNQPPDNSGKIEVQKLFASLRPKDLKKLLDKVTGRHKRRHSWTHMSEYEDTDSESKFVTPLLDHDELTRCMECGRKHTSPNGLFWHLDVKHKWSFQLTRLKATTTCPICSVFCGHWYNMAMHVIEAHGQRNWWREEDDSIMLIQPAHSELEEEVTKLDKPVDRRLSFILSQSLESRHFEFGVLDNNIETLDVTAKQQQLGSGLVMHDSVGTMEIIASDLEETNLKLFMGEQGDLEKSSQILESNFVEAAQKVEQDEFDEGVLKKSQPLEELVDGEVEESEKDDEFESTKIHQPKKLNLEGKVSGSARGLSFRLWGEDSKKLFAESKIQPTY